MLCVLIPNDTTDTDTSGCAIERLTLYRGKKVANLARTFEWFSKEQVEILANKQRKRTLLASTPQAQYIVSV